MKGEEEIRKLRDRMIERYKVGKADPNLNMAIMPADAFEVANTLSWVLEEESGITETLEHAGIDLHAQG